MDGRWRGPPAALGRVGVPAHVDAEHCNHSKMIPDRVDGDALQGVDAAEADIEPDRAELLDHLSVAVGDVALLGKVRSMILYIRLFSQKVPMPPRPTRPASSAVRVSIIPLTGSSSASVGERVTTRSSASI